MCSVCRCRWQRTSIPGDKRILFISKMEPIFMISLQIGTLTNKLILMLFFSTFDLNRPPPPISSPTSTSRSHHQQLQQLQQLFNLSKQSSLYLCKYKCIIVSRHRSWLLLTNHPPTKLVRMLYRINQNIECKSYWETNKKYTETKPPPHRPQFSHR